MGVAGLALKLDDTWGLIGELIEFDLFDDKEDNFSGSCCFTGCWACGLLDTDEPIGVPLAETVKERQAIRNRKEPT